MLQAIFTNPWLLFAQNKLELTVALLLLKRKTHNLALRVYRSAPADWQAVQSPHSCPSRLE